VEKVMPAVEGGDGVRPNNSGSEIVGRPHTSRGLMVRGSDGMDLATVTFGLGKTRSKGTKSFARLHMLFSYNKRPSFI